MDLRVDMQVGLAEVEPFVRRVDQEADDFTDSLRTWSADSWQKIMERLDYLRSSALSLDPKSLCLYMCTYETAIKYLRVHRSRARARELWKKVARVLDEVPHIVDADDNASRSNHDHAILAMSLICYEDLSRRLDKLYPGLSK